MEILFFTLPNLKTTPEWEKIFSNNVHGKGFVSRIYKELIIHYNEGKAGNISARPFLQGRYTNGHRG